MDYNAGNKLLNNVEKNIPMGKVEPGYSVPCIY